MDYDSAQDAEDAFYDALENGDIDALTAVWAADDNIACLLPMQPAAFGEAAVRDAWAQVLQQAGKLDIAVSHLHWLQFAEVAIHLVEETLNLPGAATGPAPVLYASNVYRRNGEGWQMVAHQTSPTPPPLGAPPA